MDSIRTYRVRSLHEALQRIREDLGPEAAVLHTREVSAGWFGWRSELEVTASAEISPPSRLPAQIDIAVEDDEADHHVEDRVTEIQAHLDQLAAELEQTAPGSRLQPYFTDTYAVAEEEHPAESPEAPFAAELNAAGFSPEVITDLTTAWFQQSHSWNSDTAAVQRWLAAQIKIDLPTQGPIRVPRGQQTIVAAVGPTGVGKTTSLAKLAAEYSLKQHRRVGLITVDTFRIGAVEQLRTYADIMKLPLEIVVSPEEMDVALDQLGDCELVLIDTAGRSPLDASQMRQLAKVLDVAQPHEVHLVLSAVAQVDALPDVVQRFLTVGVNRLLLTKTDEAATPGPLFDFLRSTNLPLAYLTNGQNVPEDLCCANSANVAEWLLGQRPSAAL